MRLLETRQVLSIFILGGAAGITAGALPHEVDNADKTRRPRFDEGKVRPLIMIANRALRRRPILRPPRAFFLFRFALFLPSELSFHEAVLALIVKLSHLMKKKRGLYCIKP